MESCIRYFAKAKIDFEGSERVGGCAPWFWGQVGSCFLYDLGMKGDMLVVLAGLLCTSLLCNLQFAVRCTAFWELPEAITPWLLLVCTEEISKQWKTVTKRLDFAHLGQLDFKLFGWLDRASLFLSAPTQ